MPRPPALLLSVLIAAGLTAGMLVGCTSTGQVPAAEAPSIAPAEPDASPADTSQPDASQADDPPGTVACGKAVRAARDGTLMNPGVVAGITEAAGTADAPIAEAAQSLSELHTKAVAAHDTDAEPDAIAAVSAAAAELVRTCSESGLETAG